MMSILKITQALCHQVSFLSWMKITKVLWQLSMKKSIFKKSITCNNLRKSHKYCIKLLKLRLLSIKILKMWWRINRIHFHISINCLKTFQIKQWT